LVRFTADRAEQGFAFLAGRGVAGEVHVLHHQIHLLGVQQAQAVFRRARLQRGDVVQREQHLQRGADRGIVIDDEDGGHGGVRTEAWGSW
jgi:hypothetical protein